MMGLLLILSGLGWGVPLSPRGARWCFLSPSCSSCQAEPRKAWLDHEFSPQPVPVLGRSQTRPRGACNLFLAGISAPNKMQPPLGWVVAVTDLLVVRAGHKIKGMLGFFFKEAECNCSSQ